MAKKPQKRQERRMERELAGQYREIRIRALAGALEHRGDKTVPDGNGLRSIRETKARAINGASGTFRAVLATTNAYAKRECLQ